MNEYLSMFIDETREHLQAWSDGLLELEQTEDASEVSVIFRAAHTIKGMAMTMGFQRMGELTHHAENLLDGIRQGTLSVNSEIVDALLKALDVLEELLGGVEETGTEPELETEAIAHSLEVLAKGGAQVAAATATTSQPASATAPSAAKKALGSRSNGGLGESVLVLDDRVNDIIRTVAEKAIEKGYRVYEIALGFEDACIMPMARWAQVLQQINQNELLYTHPTAEVLDAGDYDGPIRFVMATMEDFEEIGARIANISEIVVTSIHEWSSVSGTTARNEKNLLPQGNITSDEYVVNVVHAALNKGLSVYEVGIRLNAQALLKSARLYLVFESIGGQDQLLYTQPSMRDIEEEKLGTDVLFIMWSNRPIEDIRQSVERISDIELVELRQWRDEAGRPKRGENTVETKKTDKVRSSSSTKRSASTIRVDTDKLDMLMNLFSELAIDKTRLEKIESELRNDALSQTVSHMSKVTNELQEIVMSMRMVPVETVFTRFPRMVRDTAMKLDKEVDFEMTGQSTELDRTVVEEIGDPIMHMLRNSLDHGLESAADRRRAGKQEKGKIVLRAYSAGNSVFIEVEDDGCGIDRDTVLEKAVRKGIVEAGAVLTDEQVYQLLFHSGFSTAEVVTDLSGRGVGLDVVKSKIESLSGRVEVQSEKGKGTKFIIQLPMTLAIMQGLMISIDKNPYFIPLGSVAQVEAGTHSNILDGREVVVWREQVVPLVRVRKVFGLEWRPNEGYTVFIRRGKQTLGLVVDEVLGQQEVVLKSLDKRVRSVKWLSGATILGDGTVALVLDSNAFFQK